MSGLNDGNRVTSAKRTPPASAKPANGKKGKKRVAGQTEMLLPIAGKGRAATGKSRVAVKKVAGRRKAG
jgi:hypothetical protein